MAAAALPEAFDPALPGVDAGLRAVRARVAGAARRVGRTPSAVTLVAVSKMVEPERVRSAVAHGQLDFGESRAQELTRKAEAVGPGVRWHFIGRLQRNKVADVVGRATLVHSVDRLELATALGERAGRLGRVQRVLVQVNAGEDPAKTGCSLEEAPRLIAAVRKVSGLACEGLMTVPALDADPRPAFAALRALRDRVREEFPEVAHLSMGMSSDLEAAVEEGATIVRVGSAIFGHRPPAPVIAPA